MEVWNATMTMEVKIKQAETLVKELTAQITSNMLSKFKSNDIFDRYARDLKAELITVPVCANCLEFGATPVRSPEEADGEEDYQEHEEDCEELSEDECEELDNAFNYLMKLVDERMLTVQQAEDLVEWAEEQLEEGKDPNWISGKLLRAKKRKQIYSLPRFIGKERVPQICLSYTRKSKDKITEKIPSNVGESVQIATPISAEAGFSSNSLSGEEQWSHFEMNIQGINIWIQLQWKCGMRRWK